MSKHTDYAAAFKTATMVQKITFSERLTGLAMSVGDQMRALKLRVNAVGGGVGQIPVRVDGGGMGWIDAPAGTGVQGIPVGGATGQVLSKASGADYDAAWSTPAAGSGSGMAWVRT